MRINRAQLLRALRHAVACSSATAKGSGVTACALLASSGSILTVTATDYDVTGTATAPCDGDLFALVNVKALLSVVSALPDGATIDLTTDANHRLAVTAGKSRSTLAGLDPVEFPTTEMPEATGASYAVADLLGLLAAGGYAVCQDDGRPAIGGVLLTGEAGQLLAVSTDGHRLGQASLANTGEMTLTALLHRRAVAVLPQMLDGWDTATVGMVGRDVVVSTGGCALKARSIEATFPDYRKVVPERKGGTVVNAEALLAELARVAPMVSSKNGFVTVELASGVLSLDACTAEVGDAHAELEVDDQGTWKVGFNPKYLAQAVKACGAEFVTLQVGDAVSPVLVYVEGGASEHVLMPMRIS